MAERIDEPPAKGGNPPGSGGVFVGRERERETLRSGLQQTFAGRGCLFLISGEPGIGKTCLTDSLAGEASALGARIARGRCWEGGGAPIYWPWIQILRTILDAGGLQSLSSEVGRGATFVARLLPELATADQQSGLDPVSSLLASSSEGERFPLFDAIATLLRGMSAATPLFIVLDDCHAADESSLLLLKFVARDLHQSRIMLMVTFREAEVRRNERIATIIGDLAREGESITLRGVGESEAADLVNAVAAIRPDSKMLATLHHATDGNPFFLTEIVRLLIAEGGLGRGLDGGLGSFRVPHSVEALIVRRVESISTAARDVLRLGSLLGREFDLALVAQVSGIPMDVLTDAMEEAAAAGLVVEVAGAIGRYRFSHFLFAETLASRHPKKVRRQIHNRIAAELEKLARPGSDTYLPELAFHYVQALPLGDAGKAVDYAARAAAQASALLAYEEAVRLYQMSLSALALQGEEHPGRRCELLLGLGEAQAKAGDFQHSKLSYEQAFQLARTLRDFNAMVRAAMGFGTFPSAPGSVDRALIDMLQEVLDRLSATDDSQRALVLSRLAEELYLAGGENRSAELSRQAVETARRGASAAVLVEVLYRRHLVITGPDSAQERSALSSEIDRLLRESGSERWNLRARYLRVRDLAEIGEIEELDREIQSYLAIADKTRQRHLGVAEVMMAMRAMIDGRFDDAERLATEALELGQRRGDGMTLQTYAVQMSALRREQGRLAELEPMIKSFVDLYPALTFARSALAHCYCETGKPEKARIEFQRLAENDFAAVPRNVTWLPTMALLASVCSFLGDASNAATLYRMLAPYASRTAALDVYVCYGWIAHFLGLLARTMDRFQDAHEHLREALELSARIGARPWIAESEYEYARLLLSRPEHGNGEQARELFASALETARALGIKRLEDKITAATGETVAAAGAGEAAQESGEENLFRKEGDIWSIAFEGRLFRVKDIKGLGYIARLLTSPGREFHALELLGSALREPSEASASLEHLNREQLEELKLREGGLGDAGEMLDAQAKASYERRLSDLRAQLDDAREFGNTDRIARIEDEIDALARELSRAVGWGGRDRRAGSASERARLNITRAIKAAIDRIAENDRPLGEFFFKTIRTGNFCSYSPGPGTAISWQF